jgi:hypothetical protein
MKHRACQLIQEFCWMEYSILSQYGAEFAAILSETLSPWFSLLHLSYLLNKDKLHDIVQPYCVW